MTSKRKGTRIARSASASKDADPQPAEPVELLPDDQPEPTPEAAPTAPDDSGDTADADTTQPDPVPDPEPVKPAKRSKRAAAPALKPFRAGGHIDRRDGRGWVLDTKEK